MPRGTTLRNVRVEDALWTRAKRAAEWRGETLSDVVRQGLERYADEVDLARESVICKVHGPFTDTLIDSRGMRCDKADMDPRWPDEVTCRFGVV